MPPNTVDYVSKNRLHLNKLQNLYYHNKTTKIPKDQIQQYQADHTLDETILWLKIESIKLKYIKATQLK